jgi:soluble lytic murein transglycosylase
LSKEKIKAVLCLLLLLVISVIIIVNSISLVLQTVYPRRFSAIVEENAQEYNLDVALLYALIETESGFDENAVSSVGAKGLTQITSETFEWLQMKKGENHNDSALFSPEISVDYGAYFLSILIEEFGDTKTALAAYHAGRGIVNEWLNDERYSADGKTLDNIPYEDTAAYTKQVLKVRERYCYLYKLENNTSTEVEDNGNN